MPRRNFGTPVAKKARGFNERKYKMDLRAEFKNGVCKLYLIPSDDWEQKLLAAVAKGGEELNAVVTYKPEGHFSYGKCAAVHIMLEAGGNVTL